jgi:WD40 repeat protein
MKTLTAVALGLGLLCAGGATARAQDKKAAEKAVLSPDGQRLVRVDETGKLRLWDLKTGTAKELPNGGANRLLTFSPDGKLLAGAGEGGFQIWDAETGQDFKFIADMFIPAAQVKKILVAQDPHFKTKYRLYVAGEKRIAMFEAATGSPYAQAILLDGQHMLGFAADGKTLVLGGGHKITLHSLSKSEVVQLPYHFVTGVRLSPDGKRLVVNYARPYTREVLYTALYDLEQRRQLVTMPRSQGQLLFGAEGKLAID